MRHLTNTYDPERDDARFCLAVALDESRDEAWAKYKSWLADKHIGEPKAGKYTVDELKQMGYFGVYAVDES